jgi:hypothetical protein
MPRFNVDLSNQAVEVIDTLADEQGTSKADVLRQAISLQKWFTDVQKQGGKIVVEQPDGTQREVVALK